MLKKPVLLLSFFTLSVALVANNQLTTNENDSVATEEGTHFLMFSVSYSTDNTTNKNYSDIKMPTITGDIYFFAKNGIWTSFSYANYIDAPETTYETDISLGYQKYFGNYFDVDLSYKWHQFKGDTLYSGIDYNHALTLSTGLDFDFINFYVDNSIYWGSSNNYFLDLSLGFNLESDHLLTKNDNISFSPTILTSFGSNDFIYYDIIPRQIRYKGRVFNLRPEVIENTTSKFIYQSSGIIAPLIYSVGEFSFSLAWSYIIPSTQLKDLGWTNQSGFFISLTYSPNIF